MANVLRFLLCVVICCGVASAPSSAFAQRPSLQVLDLNRQAMDAYQNLDVDQAKQLLDQALQTAQAQHVTGAALARTYMNLAVVAIGGFQDNGKGLDYFTHALEADGSVQLDPLTSTPDISAMFALAKQNVARNPHRAPVEATPAPSNPPIATEDPVPARTQPAPSRPAPTPAPRRGTRTTLIHTPVHEQLAQIAIPIFAELGRGITAEHVYVSYRHGNSGAFRRVAMESVGSGYGYEIPCGEVIAPSVQYFVVAMADDADIGSAGSEREPLTVNVVTVRTQAEPPGLPGRGGATRCHQDDECPPGMDGCAPAPTPVSAAHGAAGLGDTCARNRDCESGLVCEDALCVSGQSRSSADDEPVAESRDRPAARLFVDVGFTYGTALVHDGMAADKVDPNLPGTTANPYCYMNLPTNTSGWENCRDTNGDGCIDTCDVRVQKSGVVPSFALRATVGYYVLPRLALAVTARWQFDSGAGTLANILLGGRVQFLLTRPAERGFNAAAFVGSSFGQIQVRPPQPGGGGPFVISGLNGIQLGFVLGYRFTRNFGVIVTPEFHYLLPTALINFDATASLQLSFL